MCSANSDWDHVVLDGQGSILGPQEQAWLPSLAREALDTMQPPFLTGGQSSGFPVPVNTLDTGGSFIAPETIVGTPSSIDTSTEVVSIKPEAVSQASLPFQSGANILGQQQHYCTSCGNTDCMVPVNTVEEVAAGLLQPTGPNMMPFTHLPQPVAQLLPLPLPLILQQQQQQQQWAQFRSWDLNTAASLPVPVPAVYSTVYSPLYSPAFTFPNWEVQQYGGPMNDVGRLDNSQLLLPSPSSAPTPPSSSFSSTSCYSSPVLTPTSDDAASLGPIQVVSGSPDMVEVATMALDTEDVQTDAIQDMAVPAEAVQALNSPAQTTQDITSQAGEDQDMGVLAEAVQDVQGEHPADDQIDAAEDNDEIDDEDEDDGQESDDGSLYDPNEYQGFPPIKCAEPTEPQPMSGVIPEVEDEFSAVSSSGSSPPSPPSPSSPPRLTPPDPSRIRESRRAKDDFLLQCRAQGMTYKEIKELGRLSEAESTLRGRYRVLTKSKFHRVRKPTWTPEDLRLLRTIVKARAWKKKKGKKVHVLWQKVADDMVEAGGSYPFGAMTCSCKWAEIVGTPDFGGAFDKK